MGADNDILHDPPLAGGPVQGQADCFHGALGDDYAEALVVGAAHDLRELELTPSVERESMLPGAGYSDREELSLAVHGCLGILPAANVK